MNNITALNLSNDDFRRLVNEIAADASTIQLTRHALVRMKERRILRKHIDICLQKGIVVEPPHINIHGNWQAAMLRNVAGLAVKVVVAVDLEKRLIVITAMTED